VRKYGKNFLRIRDQLLKKYKGIEVVSRKQFVHSGLVYPFMLHNLKLNEFCKHEGLNDYLLKLDSWADKYFVSGSRCSQLRSVAEVDVTEKRNFLCKAVGHVLDACADLKERHSLVQKYLLHNDNATIATEVPVWAYDKKLGAISGHIDILQIRFGKVWIADYKPGAKREDKSKVISQLFWYARSLSFRANIPLSEIRCCYFDEEVCVEFDSSKVKIKISHSAMKTQPICNTPSAGKTLHASVANAITSLFYFKDVSEINQSKCNGFRLRNVRLKRASMVHRTLDVLLVRGKMGKEKKKKLNYPSHSCVVGFQVLPIVVQISSGVGHGPFSNSGGHCPIMPSPWK
jgi:hypothetical protein